MDPFSGPPGEKFMRHHGHDACPCSPSREVEILCRDGVTGTGWAGRLVWGWGKIAHQAEIVGWRWPSVGTGTRRD
jgi:hypothetical protein